MAGGLVEAKQRPDHTYETPAGAILPGISWVMRVGGYAYEFSENRHLDTGRGNRVHEAIQFWLEDGDFDGSQMALEELGCVEAAKRAIHELKIEPLKVEWAVANETFGYGTALDVYAKRGDKHVVINWKTGQRYRYYAVQSALEALLFSPLSVERLGIHLKSDGTYQPVEYRDRQDFVRAKAALTTAAWRREEEKLT